MGVWLADIADRIDPMTKVKVDPRKHEQCERKKSYRTQAACEKERKRLSLENALRNDHWPLHVYRCPHGFDGHWHVGHVPIHKEVWNG